jgi:hypothetical protein
MRAKNVKKLIRVTGALVGRNPFSIFSVLFNGLLSMTVMWHEASEIEIRKSGLDYTCIRPTEMTSNEPVMKTTNQTLYLFEDKSNDRTLKFISRIPRQDVADLCVLAALPQATNDDSMPPLHKTSVICTSGCVKSSDKRETDWSNYIKRVRNVDRLSHGHRFFPAQNELQTTLHE